MESIRFLSIHEITCPNVTATMENEENISYRSFMNCIWRKDCSACIPTLLFFLQVSQIVSFSLVDNPPRLRHWPFFFPDNAQVCSFQLPNSIYFLAFDACPVFSS